MFRRRRRAEEADPVELEDLDEIGATEAAEAEVPGPEDDVPGPPPPLSDRSEGPWDADEPVDDRPRVDLGALRVAVPEGVELRLDVSPDGQIVAATLIDGQSTVQLGAFAAPRTEGIWAEVREEIVASIAETGGRVEEVPGRYGVELAARVPGEPPAPGRMPPLVPVRFVGVDGPRWFLRALVTGPAATDPAAAGRGRARAAAGGDPGPAGAPPGPGLRPPERGPEITEVR